MIRIAFCPPRFGVCGRVWGVGATGNSTYLVHVRTIGPGSNRGPGRGHGLKGLYPLRTLYGTTRTAYDYGFVNLYADSYIVRDGSASSSLPNGADDSELADGHHYSMWRADAARRTPDARRPGFLTRGEIRKPKSPGHPAQQLRRTVPTRSRF